MKVFLRMFYRSTSMNRRAILALHSSDLFEWAAMRNAPTDWTLNFSGHESFPLRYSWLNKGFKRIQRDYSFFGKEDAMVTLGVGKNMVFSIRHWGLATQVWEEKERSRGKQIRPTRFGNALFKGWDPFLEHPGTYWSLHWHIVTNPSKATTWTVVFNRPAARFSQEQLLQELLDLAANHGDRKSSGASLKRDIEVFKRSYLQPVQKKGVYQEDELDCPFKQLGLLRPTTTRGEFELVVGARPSLPLEVFEFAILDHLGHEPDQSRKEIAVEDLLYGWNSPGRVFRLSESSLMDRLHQLAEWRPSHFSMDETIGLRRFIVEAKTPSPLSALDSYYLKWMEPTHA